MFKKIILISLLVVTFFSSCSNPVPKGEINDFYIYGQDSLTTVNMLPDESETLSIYTSPSDLSGYHFSWSSSDTTVVNVNNGIINALKVGTAIITAKVDNTNLSDSIDVHVNDPLEKVDIFVFLGDSLDNPVDHITPDINYTLAVRPKNTKIRKSDFSISATGGELISVVSSSLGGYYFEILHCLKTTQKEGKVNITTKYFEQEQNFEIDIVNNTIESDLYNGQIWKNRAWDAEENFYYFTNNVDYMNFDSSHNIDLPYVGDGFFDDENLAVFRVSEQKYNLRYIKYNAAALIDNTLIVQIESRVPIINWANRDYYIFVVRVAKTQSMNVKLIFSHIVDGENI